MAIIDNINILSYDSTAEGLDITVFFPDRGRVVFHVERNKKRPLRTDREIGVNGATVLSSLHALRQMVNHYSAQVSDAVVQLVDALATCTEDLTVPEQTMRYEQLPHPRCIRLFRVDRAILRPIGPKSFDVSIYGTLEPFDWEEAPPYSALSYTWGHPYVDFNLAEPEPVPEITSHIIVNGEVLRVTDNLHSALAYLSTIADFGYLWIDAICINQSDEAEKAAQVAQMDVVYSRAAQVLGWLGYPHVSVPEFLWATSDLVQRFKRHDLYLRRQPWPADTLYDPAMDAYFGVEDLALTLSGAYYFYLACRWFRRAWVLQEMVLAEGRVRLFCGHDELSWAKLGDFRRLMSITGWHGQVEWLGSQCVACKNRTWMREVAIWQLAKVHLDRHLHPSPADGDGNGDTSQPSSLQGVEISTHAPGTPARDLSILHDLLTTTSCLECTVPQDHVFASIGIAGPAFKSRIQSLTAVTYNMAPRDFYLNIATAVASHSRYLDFLVDAGLRDPELGEGQALPTWAPTYIRPRVFETFSGRPPTLLNAGRCDDKPPPFCVSNAVLHCSAVPFDTIVDLVDLSETTLRVDILGFAASFPAPTINNGRLRLETLWRTLILDFADGETPAPTTFGAHFLATIPSEDGPVVSKQQRQGTLDAEAYLNRCDAYLHDLDAASLTLTGDHELLPITSTNNNDMTWRRYLCIPFPSAPLGRRKPGSSRAGKHLRTGIGDDTRAYVDAYTHNAEVNPMGRNPLPEKIVEVDRVAFPYIRASNHFGGRKTLYKTRGGRLGVCGGPCRVGDGVWALRNAHFPFVLRVVDACKGIAPDGQKEGGYDDAARFQVVGPCFMLGFMEGEMVTDRVKERVIGII